MTIQVHYVNAKFLSTPSARRATCKDDYLNYQQKISIHALREEGDPDTIGGFNAMLTRFLSTPSARRATPPAGAAAATWGHISIHALREEGDRFPQAGI